MNVFKLNKSLKVSEPSLTFHLLLLKYNVFIKIGF